MTNFENISKSPEALAEFLEGLNLPDSPWERYCRKVCCGSCALENCDKEKCKCAEDWGNPMCWLFAQVELTAEDLRGMVGSWVWVDVKYKHGHCDGWAFVATPSMLGYLEQMLKVEDCGTKFTAYPGPPEKTLTLEDMAEMLANELNEVWKPNGKYDYLFRADSQTPSEKG